MASALIQERRTVSGNQFAMRRLFEDAGQAFLAGTPLMVNPVTGMIVAWDGVTILNGIAGISKTFGAGLTLAGVPLGTPAWGINVGGGQTFGSVQNEPLAANFSRPMFNDGMTDVVLANQDNVFYAQVGPLQATALTDIGMQYGMTIDPADNHWYVDKLKLGPAAVCTVLDLDVWDTARGVLIQFLPGVTQIPA